MSMVILNTVGVHIAVLVTYPGTPSRKLIKKHLDLYGALNWDPVISRIQNVPAGSVSRAMWGKQTFL